MCAAGKALGEDASLTLMDPLVFTGASWQEGGRERRGGQFLREESD